MLFTDAVAITNTRTTRDGYMVVDARFARTGVQLYAGDEMDRPDMDTVRVYRSAEEVFSDRAMGSFAHRPVTDNHPTQMVTAETWKDAAVGMTGDVVTRDGEHVRIPFTLMDASVIRSVADGKRELSAGYTATIDWTPGTAPDGEAYDARMTNISGNHLAIVARGRAGSSCRIGDAWADTTTTRKDPAMADANRSVMLDGLTITTNDAGAQAIEKLTRDLAAARGVVETKDGELAGLRSANASAVQAKDGQIAALTASHKSALEAKDGEIAALKAAVPDAKAMDALITARAGVIDGAKRILGTTFDASGKTVEDIRRATVSKRLGDMAGKSDEYVHAAFDTILADGATRADPLREVLRDGIRTTAPLNDTSTAHAEMVARLQNGWKGQKVGA